MDGAEIIAILRSFIPSNHGLFKFDQKIVNEQPVTALSNLFIALGKTRMLLPKFHYVDSPGADAGGLTRSGVTSLVKSFCSPKNDCIKNDESGYIPQVNTKSKITLEDQTNSYRALGRIFCCCFEGPPIRCHCSHFHPVTFQMLFDLPKARLDEFSYDMKPDAIRMDSPAVQMLVNKYTENFFKILVWA